MSIVAYKYMLACEYIFVLVYKYINIKYIYLC